MILGMSLSTFVNRPRDHQPDRDRCRPFFFIRHVRASHLQLASGADRDILLFHDFDQRTGFLDSASAVRKFAAVDLVGALLAVLLAIACNRALRHEASAAWRWIYAYGRFCRSILTYSFC